MVVFLIKKKVLAFSLVFFVFSLMIVSLSSTNMGVSTETTPEQSQASPMDELTLTGDIFTIHVENETAWQGIGCYTIETGTSHTNASKSILYHGSLADPWTTYLTIHVVETKTDYVTTIDASYITPSISGYSVINMDSYVTSGPSISGNAIITIWTLPEGLVVTQTLVSEGSTMEDGRFRATTTVTNNNPTESYTVGIRYEWDYAIDDIDGSVMRTINPNSTYFTTEKNWTNPTFEYYEESDYVTPTLTVLSSVNEPTSIAPRATPPTRLVFTHFNYGYLYSYNYTTHEEVITDDSCMLYLWDNNELDENGGSVGVTAYIATPQFVVSHPPDTTDPTIDQPADITYEEGSTGHSITWNPSDANPLSYTVTRDGTFVDGGPWSGSSITVNVEGLSVGTYIYNCTVYDTAGNSASDIVNVTVTSPTEAPEFLSTTLGFATFTISLLVLAIILYKRNHLHRTN